MLSADPQELFDAAITARGAVSEQERIAFDWQMRWLTNAHAHQIEPLGDNWTIWMLMAGRGAGKTRCAAEWIGAEAWRDPGSRSLVAAPTASDVRDTCFEGESGLLAVIPPALVKDYNRSLSEIVMANGSLIKGIPASEPSRFRGGQWHRAWTDELAAWTYDEEALDMIMFALRLGQKPRLVATTTPRPRSLIRSLLARNGKDVAVTKASSMSNMSNLAPTFRDQIMQYSGTALFRQEALGELIDPEESGLVKRSQFRLWPADKPLPPLNWIVMSLDTAFTEATGGKKGGDPDYSACTVWGGFDIEEPGALTPRSLDDIPELEDDKPHARRTGGYETARDMRSFVMLLDCWQERLGLPDLITRVKRELNTAYGDDHDKALIKPMFGASKPRTSGRKPDLVIIEDKGSGISLRQTLDREGIMTYAYNPGRADKLTRLHLVSPVFARRLIWIPESNKFPGKPRTWVEPLLHQLCSFTGSGSIKHDDLVDSAAQALRYFVDKGMLSALSPLSQGVSAPKTASINPYTQ